MDFTAFRLSFSKSSVQELLKQRFGLSNAHSVVTKAVYPEAPVFETEAI